MNTFLIPSPEKLLHLQYLYGLQQEFVLNFNQVCFSYPLLLIFGNTVVFYRYNILDKFS